MYKEYKWGWGWLELFEKKWLNYSDLTFNLKLAPKAHLPYLEGVVGGRGMCVLLSRKDL